MGAIGKDHNAEIMKEKAQEVGLNTIYQVNETLPTGTCAVLITHKDRSLVAHLAAADKFTADHLDNDHHWSFVQKAKIFYVTGFFFTVCPEAIQRLAKFATENERTFCINLSAPFLSEFFKDRLVAALPHVDVVFGNDDVSFGNSFFSHSFFPIFVKLFCSSKGSQSVLQKCSK
jgi:adenosine kinase